MICVSGSQGQGKSTVLNTLSELGYMVNPNKTAREILAEWDFGLEQVNSYPPLTQNFQKETLKRQIEIANKYKGQLVFQERSFADIFTYAMMSMGSYNSYSAFISAYYDACKQRQQQLDCIIYISGRKDYIPENDGVRSINPHYAKCVDLIMRHYIDEFDNGNVLYLDTPYHDERVRIIVEHVERLKTKTQNLQNDSLDYWAQNPHG